MSERRLATLGSLMVRILGILLVIWGLIAQPSIAQPLVTDTPVPMTDHYSHTSMELVDDQSPMSNCHDEAVESASSKACDNCDDDCMNGMCATSCTASGVVAPQKLTGSIDIQGSIAISSLIRVHAHGLPSRIFHPPKHS